MRSQIEIESLQGWVNRILDESTCKYSVVLALGNSIDLLDHERAECLKVQQGIRRHHSLGCPDCMINDCNRIQFIDCPLTGCPDIKNYL
jgi:hypothetical protein